MWRQSRVLLLLLGALVLCGHLSAVWWFEKARSMRASERALRGSQDSAHDAGEARLARAANAGRSLRDTHGGGAARSAHGAAAHPAGAVLPTADKLIGGKTMARVGFGTAGLGGTTKAAVAQALRVGYRHIDTAMAREWYRDDLVGEAVAESGVPRDELFLTTKIHPKDLGLHATRRKVDEALRNLRTGYVDLVLLHYPQCFWKLCPEKPEGTWRDAWRALEGAVREGKVRAIGVSNFGARDLAELVQHAEVQPAVVQTHSDPLRPNQDVQDFCAQHGIRFTAYSSLGTQHREKTNPVLSSGVIGRIAKAHNSSPAVVTLAWGLAHGQTVIPRSRSEAHQRENLRAAELQLTPSEVAEIDGLRKR